MKKKKNKSKIKQKLLTCKVKKKNSFIYLSRGWFLRPISGICLEKRRKKSKPNLEPESFFHQLIFFRCSNGIL
jgi:hypothetical protein